MKSVTEPWRMRSVRLPVAPPRRRARPAAFRELMPRPATSSQAMTAMITREPISRARFDPSLGGAVKRDDSEGQPEETKARRKSHEIKEVKEVKEAEETAAVNILGCRHSRGAGSFDFGEGFGAALANGGIAGVFANVGGIIPAALAFGAVGALDLDRQARESFGRNGCGDRRCTHFDLGDDEKCRQKRLFFFKELLKRSAVRIDVEQNFCFKAAADDFCSAGLFESYEHRRADLREALPFFHCVFGDTAGEGFGFREQSHVNAFGFVLQFRQILPDFLGGENEDRSGEADERAGDFPDSGLRGAARFISGRLGIETVLQHVEIECAEVHDAIIVDGVVDTVEFVIRVPFAAFLDKLDGTVEHPRVELLELIVRKRIARRIEISEVPEGEAKGIANLAIGFAELGHHALAHFYVGLVFNGADPEADQVRAPLFADFDGVERVAERLGHGAALLVERPAVGDDAAIGRSVADARGNKQRAVEPAAILIGAFEIDVGGPLGALQNGEIRRTGVKPDVENVVFLAPFCGAAGAGCAGGEQFFRGVLIPGVGAFLFEPFHDVAQSGEILEARPACVAIENDDGNAPETLAGDAPVRALLNHFVHAVFAPSGNPFDAVDFFERFLAQGFLFSMRGLVHFDEPLLSGAKNYGIVAAPTVRVAVLVLVVAEERAAIVEQLYNNGIRGENVLAFVFGQAFEIDAFVVKGRVDLQCIFLAGIEVVGAVAGSAVNDAAALIKSDVIRENSGHLNGEKWMLKFHTLEIAALEGGANFGFLDAALGLQSGHAVGGQKQCALFGFDDGVVEIGMKGERAIVRNGPGSSGPDDGADFTVNFRGIPLAAADNCELHPNRRAGVIFVFDFGFGERGAVVEAPVDGLAAAVDVALFHEIEKRSGDRSLVFMAHR